ncbi:MAG: hypothetical protein NC112_01095 [Oxalobacter formigenes]|nr:hypothetical protein [Oxalobacter formigenes]
MKSRPEPNQSGTYYYVSGKYDKWSTFDQILLSSAWLNNGWEVENENELAVLDENILRIVASNKFKIDHLPVRVQLGKDNLNERQSFFNALNTGIARVNEIRNQPIKIEQILEDLKHRYSRQPIIRWR